MVCHAELKFVSRDDNEAEKVTQEITLLFLSCFLSLSSVVR